MEPAYDAVIVGSGFGGGVTACRLAEAGWRVCVLERGRRFGRGDFPDRPEQAPHLLWHRTANPGGLFDLRLMRDVAVLTGVGVGGGSLIYANVQLRAPEEAFERDWPEAITRRELDPHYDRTEEALDPRPSPGTPPLRKIPAFAALARRAGRRAEPLPLAVHFGDDRLHPFSGAPQQGCTNLARCNVGCPRHAKNTVDITYLARAEQYGAEVYPLHEVARLEPPERGGGSWRVGFRDLQYGVRGRVEAPVLILAASALGSTRLLLKNRGRLKGLSPALGTRFSGNGDALGGAFDPRAPDVAGAQMHIGHIRVRELKREPRRARAGPLPDGRLRRPDGSRGHLDLHRRVRARRRPALGLRRIHGRRGKRRPDPPDRALRRVHRGGEVPGAAPRPRTREGRPLVQRRRRGDGLHGVDLRRDPPGAA